MRPFPCLFLELARQIQHERFEESLPSLMKKLRPTPTGRELLSQPFFCAAIRKRRVEVFQYPLSKHSLDPLYSITSAVSSLWERLHPRGAVRRPTRPSRVVSSARSFTARILPRVRRDLRVSSSVPPPHPLSHRSPSLHVVRRELNRAHSSAGFARPRACRLRVRAVRSFRARDTPASTTEGGHARRRRRGAVADALSAAVSPSSRATKTLARTAPRPTASRLEISGLRMRVALSNAATDRAEGDRERRERGGREKRSARAHARDEARRAEARKRSRCVHRRSGARATGAAAAIARRRSDCRPRAMVIENQHHDRRARVGRAVADACDARRGFGAVEGDQRARGNRGESLDRVGGKRRGRESDAGVHGLHITLPMLIDPQAVRRRSGRRRTKISCLRAAAWRRAAATDGILVDARRRR